MTVEEKAKKIEAYCGSMVECSDCELSNVNNTTCYDKAFPEEIENNYKIIFGDDEKKEIYRSGKQK